MLVFLSGDILRMDLEECDTAVKEQTEELDELAIELEKGATFVAFSSLVLWLFCGGFVAVLSLCLCLCVSLICRSLFWNRVEVIGRDRGQSTADDR